MWLNDNSLSVLFSYLEEHFCVADELSCTEPESSQVPDCSSRDHQQGKPPLLQAIRAKTSSHSDPYATEIRKTTDDSISKVLDWFNRSSHSDDSVASLQYPQDIQPRKKPDSKPQIAVALVTGLFALSSFYCTKTFFVVYGERIF